MTFCRNCTRTKIRASRIILKCIKVSGLGSVIIKEVDPTLGDNLSMKGDNKP